MQTSVTTNPQRAYSRLTPGLSPLGGIQENYGPTEGQTSLVLNQLQQLFKHMNCLQTVSMENVTAKNGTEWRWEFHPADAPYRNGAAEAAENLLKRVFTSLGGTIGSLIWGELQTLLYQAASLTNECL